VVVAAAALLAMGIAIPAMAVLNGSPSSFEANDGNMIVNTMGNNDWNSVTTNSNYVHLTDLASTTGDDSFKSGQKQDTVCPVIATNKNPPKDDFTDVASFNETNLTSGDTFLYGATIRFTPNGNASENVELNKGTSGNCGTDPVTGVTLLARTVGDKLIAIDYLNGGTNVQFHVLTWIDGTDSSNPTCSVKTDAPPCWGAVTQTLSASSAEGLTNQAAIPGNENGISGAALTAGEFAEFGVNLTAAGIVPANSCAAFPQTVWESRSSGASFVSSTEDIALEHHTITNCGNLVVKKVTVPSPDPTATSFPFTLNGDNPPNTSLPKSFSLTNGGSNTTQVFAASDFSVAETVPTNWVLTSASCDNGSGALSGNTLSGISVAVDKTTTCTFTDTEQLGAIRVTKTSSKVAGTPLSGAVFSVTGPGGFSTNLTTDSNGTACVDQLSFGSYVVTETTPPTGYDIDNANGVTVAVNRNATCTSGTPNAPPTFTDTPLTDIAASATSEVAGGTQSTVTCTGTSDDGKTTLNSSDGPKGSASVSATKLHPGTYTCTILIDP
jgi:hypothetical protein